MSSFRCTKGDPSRHTHVQIASIVTEEIGAVIDRHLRIKVASLGISKSPRTYTHSLVYSSCLPQLTNRISQVVAHGGLRKVMAKEAQDPTFSTDGNPPIVTKKRKEREASTENQAQASLTPKKPRLSSGSPRERSAFDGESLPWPVSPTSWNNPSKLRSIMKDLKSFAQITEVRIPKLEAERKRMSSTEYWNQEAADLFSDGQLNLGMRE